MKNLHIFKLLFLYWIRFEVHIEMTLPDTDERLDILNLHLSKAKSSNRLSSDIRLDRSVMLMFVLVYIENHHDNILVTIAVLSCSQCSE